MKKALASALRKLAAWLDPVPPAPAPGATVQGGGPGNTPPPPGSGTDA